MFSADIFQFAESAAKRGRGISSGQSPPSGQLSENHCIAASKRPTVMSEPVSNARSFLPSSKTRKDTVDSGTISLDAYRRATVSSFSMDDIPAHNGKYTGLSTANLPGALKSMTGQNTGMDLAVILANIERRLAVLNLSADEASRLAGRPDAIRNLRRKVRNNTTGGSLRADTLDAIARVLKLEPDELKRPPSDATAVIPGMREYLLAQRELIDRQIAALDEAEFTAKNVGKRKIR